MSEVKKTVFDTGDTFVFECPHCDELTQVHKNEVNCQIFRHAAYFTTLPPTPHTYSREYREDVCKMFDSMLIPGKLTDMILSYVGELPRYIPTQPIHPHMPKDQCEQLVKDGKVLGCAKPFKFFFSSDGNYVDICDYI